VRFRLAGEDPADGGAMVPTADRGAAWRCRSAAGTVQARPWRQVRAPPRPAVNRIAAALRVIGQGTDSRRPGAADTALPGVAASGTAADGQHRLLQEGTCARHQDWPPWPVSSRSSHRSASRSWRLRLARPELRRPAARPPPRASGRSSATLPSTWAPILRKDLQHEQRQPAAYLVHCGLREQHPHRRRPCGR